MSDSMGKFSRRMLLQMGLTIPPALLAACVAPGARTPRPAEPAQVSGPQPVQPTSVEAAQTAEQMQLPPTPACDDGDDDPTPAQTAGPFYTPNSPERASFLEPGVVGTPILVTGYVLTTSCQPIGGALLDFWHADDAGVYDNSGYRLRGHFFSDEQGRWQLETIVPGLYPGRTRHFHVRVQAANQPVLTTQLYFPDEPSNARDGIFRPDLLMDVQDSDGGKVAMFDFVLQAT